MNTECIALRTDGFVRNLNSRNPFDVIRADVVLSRMEKSANHGCGQWYEIYEARLLSAAMRYLSDLPLKDQPVFTNAAAQRGITLTTDELQRAHRECDDVMRELQADY